MPNILALECASETCSVALSHNSEIIEKISVSPQRHNELLLPMVSDVLSQAQLSISDIDAFAFGRGPGSFTGIRIAASVIQGLAFATNKAVIPVSSLAALAQGAFDEHQCTEVLTIVDARMGEIYWAHYKPKERIMRLIGNECLCLPSKAPVIQEYLTGKCTTLMVVGNAYAYEEELASANNLQLEWMRNISATAKDVAKLALVSFEAGDIYPAEKAIPVYLRETVNWKKLPGR